MSSWSTTDYIKKILYFKRSKMYLIKLGGSIFAPKTKENFSDQNYLHKFSDLINQIKEPIVLVHGTGNFWHWLVKKYGINRESYQMWLDIEKNLISNISSFFKNYKRLHLEWYQQEKLESNQNYIIGWGMSSDIKVISSDIIFSNLLMYPTITKAFIFSDVPGILDKNNEIIPEIKSPEDASYFWEKEWDVTGSMKSKILELYKYNSWSKKIVYLSDWNDFKTMKRILNGEKDLICTKIIL